MNANTDTAARSARQMNSAGFLRQTVAPLLAGRVAIDMRPAVGVDERLNNTRHVGALVRRLVASQTVSHSIALWNQARQKATGEIFYAAGGPVVHQGLTGRDPCRLIKTTFHMSIGISDVATTR